ncbi:hypothetical protein ACTUVN_002637 [Pseudomonas caspiana]
MSQPIVKSLIDEQLEEVERSFAIIRFGMPFNEVIGRPREFLVSDLPKRLAATIKGGRIAVRVRT